MPLIAIVLWCLQTLTKQCPHTWRVSTTGERDRARRLVLMVGVVVLGLAVALGVVDPIPDAIGRRAERSGEALLDAWADLTDEELDAPIEEQ